MPTVLLIGAADTGRAPMAAALLRRAAAQRGYDWTIASAGVVGHDGDPAEPEARDAMLHLGLDISGHRARSLSEELAVEADLLLAVESGTARVVRARFPAAAPRLASLGDLAGRPRDIPDPFRMQIGAWIAYARELDDLLRAALPRIAGRLGAEPPAAPESADAAALEAPPPAAAPAARAEAAARIERVLAAAAELPEIVDWPAARARIEADLAAASTPAGADDLVAPFVALVGAALGMAGARPSAGQLAALREAAARLARPIGQPDITWLSQALAGWAGR